MDMNLMLDCVSDGSGLLEPRVLATLAKSGVCLGPTDIARIAECRRSLLAEAERVEFDATGLNVLAEELTTALFCERDEFVATLEVALEMFYEFREKFPIEVSDEEISHEIASALAHEEGCVDRIDAEGLLVALTEMLTDNLRDENDLGQYCIEDAAGKIYRTDGEEWLYDECCEGWGGERWEADYE